MPRSHPGNPRGVPGRLDRRCVARRSRGRSPLTPTDLTACTATDLLALYRSREASPVEATQAVLARIDRLNPKLLAYCHVAPDDALASARASEARWRKGEPVGALDGVPTSLKA